MSHLSLLVWEPIAASPALLGLLLSLIAVAAFVVLLRLSVFYKEPRTAR